MRLSSFDSESSNYFHKMIVSSNSDRFLHLSRLHHHQLFWFILALHHSLNNAIYISSSSRSSLSSSSSIDSLKHFDDSMEQCYYHINTGPNGYSSKSIFYGQCMSMSGPDGCCLDGHYKPGICSNLGHICCTKPDPECNAMRTNKGNLKICRIEYINLILISSFLFPFDLFFPTLGITKSILKQYRQMFKQSNDHRSKDELIENGQNRAIRSNTGTYRHRKYRYRTNFEIIEMPAHMQLDAVTFVVDALDRYNGNFDDAADYLCQMLDQKYSEPSPWACTIGKDFGYSVESAPGKYMLFYVGQDVRVMAFVSKNV